MSNAELNEMIEWCRKKIREEQSKRFGMGSKERYGYTTAMKAVMSYLHSLKETNNERKN